MKIKTIRFVPWLVIGAVSLAIGLVLTLDNWDYVRPRLSHYKELATRAMSPRYRQSMEAIAAHVREQGPSSGRERFDYVREFVNGHSVHAVDDEFAEYAFQEEKVMPLLWGNLQQENEKPHLSCGPRTYAMKQVLEALGHEARVVDIFDGTGQSHTFLEVFDEVADSWQIQDPDYNVTYRAEDGKLLSAVELITRPRMDVHIVGDVDEQLKKNVARLPRYFRAAVIRETYDGRRATFLYNPDRFEDTNGGLSRTDFLRGIREKYHQPSVIYVANIAPSSDLRAHSRVVSTER